ncbi:selenoprotein M-like [Macrosteles quadrilineatus]|uniref:selenoprotein M-like n=1 Tax=Macrosteles quadrilineatus TaxID=74068 RepID=UPI0023E2F377|nr:selenoprotein M-like [Macrosteles quadrilineatus]XP_054274972.1 selenoprotein M-like [Macrosteles quadrilineatus]XP_054274973.1 selenoprotein M-like [Macrosteles quadrilineatus]XP_054274974.1 selenoprotein M-like [Macrosteles quadrilineatus]XP_054275325.1 selenoprotein M-like [Macrosteles quadrilineatus]XP_054275326.1 selenoprotein M-like [Macrosteles quadrilineatus]
MIKSIKYLFPCVLILILLGNVQSGENIEPNLEDVARGEVQSCRGCSLNRLPDVKTFIYGDLPKYSGVEFHPIPGAVPHLVLFDKSDKELYRTDLSHLSRQGCNDLVKKYFKLKDEEEDQIEIPAVVKEVKEEL